MITQPSRHAIAARRQPALLAALLALSMLMTAAAPVQAQLEPLPQVPAAVDYAPTPLDQGSPLLGGGPPLPPPPSLPLTAEPVWTPYGEATISRSQPNEGSESEPCYDCTPTGFEGSDAPWEFLLMPKSLIWHSYLAGPWEPRFASVWSSERSEGWLWDVNLGGRVACVGTARPIVLSRAVGNCRWKAARCPGWTRKTRWT